MNKDRSGESGAAGESSVNQIFGLAATDGDLRQRLLSGTGAGSMDELAQMLESEGEAGERARSVLRGIYGDDPGAASEQLLTYSERRTGNRSRISTRKRGGGRRGRSR